jgi:hypothetical protein
VHFILEAPCLFLSHVSSLLKLDNFLLHNQEIPAEELKGFALEYQASIGLAL